MQIHVEDDDRAMSWMHRSSDQVEAILGLIIAACTAGTASLLLLLALPLAFLPTSRVDPGILLASAFLSLPFAWSQFRLLYRFRDAVVYTANEPKSLALVRFASRDGLLNRVLTGSTCFLSIVIVQFIVAVFFNPTAREIARATESYALDWILVSVFHLGAAYATNAYMLVGLRMFGSPLTFVTACYRYRFLIDAVVASALLILYFT